LQKFDLDCADNVWSFTASVAQLRLEDEVAHTTTAMSTSQLWTA